jgi:Lrp/AsnC family transcriptional regulator, leucine-responsive regulatory protein
MTDIDPIDAKILHHLSGDGRLANLLLAERIGLSPSACSRRVQDLEKRGLIRGYRAVLDRGQLGVGLSKHTKEDQKGFEVAIALAAEVRECHNVTGGFEYLLRVETADLAAYKHFHTEVLGILPQVSSISTFVVMDSPKDDRA